MFTPPVLRSFLPLLILSISGLSPLSAESLVLEPYPTTGKPQGSPSVAHNVQKMWLTNFYQSVSIFRKSVPEETEISNQLKTASQAFLEMRLDDADEALSDALRLLASAPPFSTFQKKYFEAVSLKLLVALERHSKNGVNFELPVEAAALLGSDKFRASLPSGVISKVEETQKSANKSAATPPAPCEYSQAYLNGEKVSRIPATLLTGRYLVHLLCQNEVRMYWLDIGAQSSWQPQGDFEIWTHAESQEIKSALFKSKPPQVGPGDVTVIARDDRGQMLPLTYFAQENKIQAGTKSTSTTTDFDPFDEPKESRSILQSPWFWVGTAIVLGTVGYFAYSATETKHVTTP